MKASDTVHSETKVLSIKLIIKTLIFFKYTICNKIPRGQQAEGLQMILMFFFVPFLPHVNVSRFNKNVNSSHL